PIWMDNYSKFLSELCSNFRPHNPTRDAECQIKHLQMCKNQCLNKYMVKFNHFASQIQGWGKGALCDQFHKGLPLRIKNKITHIRKLDSLAELQILAQTIDSCYWEQHSKVSRETTT
ncbi:hypothetical protein SERLA73DRAFT_44058, partial [Serpula lacrymans var. lacrymans S7.3]